MRGLGRGVGICIGSFHDAKLDESDDCDGGCGGGDLAMSGGSGAGADLYMILSAAI